jgi:NADH dehydrogenase FAD-containing subunit
VLIVGGGDVAVELAAEIAGAWRGRKQVCAAQQVCRLALAACPPRHAAGRRPQVTLVTSRGRLLDRMPPAASRHAAAWLQARGVQLVLGQRAGHGPAARDPAAPAGGPAAAARTSEPGHERPAEAGARGVVLADGRQLTADLAYWCTGERPCAIAYRGLLASAPRGSERPHLLPTLQLAGAPAVLAAGDCALPAGQRTAFAAELSAGLAARNVRRLAAGQAPLRFPEGARPRAARPAGRRRRRAPREAPRPAGACHGAATVPIIAAVSLHKADGVLQFNRLVLCGLPAAVTKWLVECLQVGPARRPAQLDAHCRSRPLLRSPLTHAHAAPDRMSCTQVHAARGSWLHGAAWDCFEAAGGWLGAFCFR